jgi:rRNA-processing protein FCF1
MASSKKAPKKAAKPSPAKGGKPAPKKASKPPKKPAPKASAPRKAEPAPKPAPASKAGPPLAPVEDPDFVRKASPAERKAALQAILERERVEEALPHAAPLPPSLPAPAPAFVREVSPLERKAVVEQLVEESGVAGVLAKAPWKRGPAAAPAAPQASPAPPTPAPPAPKNAPRAVMTKAPIEQTTGRSPPRVVILDSNALMMQFQFHVDIEKEVRRLLSFNFDVVVPRIVLDELARIAKEGNQKEAGEARMALELAKTFRIEDSPGDGDTGILRLAERLNALVVTNDKVLRARLRAKDIPNIYMRSRAFLTIEGHIAGM